MNTVTEHCLKRVLALQVRLYACRERLAACSDSEALHDLRIALRQLRSLLRPLRGLPRVEGLEAAAAELGRLSGPLRDREVLAAELQRLGLLQLLPADAHSHADGYAAIAGSAELADLLAQLDAWPDSWREACAQRSAKRLRQRIRLRLQRQQQQLALALRDPAHDRHRLRLLIKRVRYAAEAYPHHSGLNRAQLAYLRRAQSSLGDWHDCLQWLTQAETEVSLRACRSIWQPALEQAAEEADTSLLVLLKDFPLG